MGEFNLFKLDDILNIDVFYLKLIFGFLSALFISFISIPKIIKVSYRKHLMDVPGERSSHEKRIPNLGGLAIFFAITVAASIFSYEIFAKNIFLFASLVILMFIGLMDDILVVAPDKKLYAQIFTAAMITIGSDVRIGNFFGVLGIYEINQLVSIIFTILVFVIFINSFNLIDGIDGLAGGIAIVISSAFAFSFYKLYDLPMVVLSLVIIGSVLGFLYFNLSNRTKIFMGDTGSMLLGFLLTFMTVKFLNLLMIEKSGGVLLYYLPTAPAIAIAILIIPIVDTLSVTVIRLWYGKSPLSADKNHLHHKFISTGLSHKQTSGILVLINLFILIITYLIRKINVNYVVVIVLLLGFLLTYFLYYVLKRINSNHTDK